MGQCQSLTKQSNYQKRCGVPGAPHTVTHGDHDHKTCGNHTDSDHFINCEPKLFPMPVDASVATAKGKEWMSRVAGNAPVTPDKGLEIISQIREENDMAGFHYLGGTGSGKALQTASIETKKHAVEVVNYAVDLAVEEHGDGLCGVSGMSEGFDKLLAMTFIERHIPWVAVVPSRSYPGYYWRDHSHTGRNMLPLFNEMIGLAEEVIYVMEDIFGLSGGGVYFDRENHRLHWNKRAGHEHTNMVRNSIMVTGWINDPNKHGDPDLGIPYGADSFLVWDPTTPGTKDAYGKIRKTNKPYWVLTQ